MPLLGRLCEHWPLKLLSLAFAVALWAFVVSQGRVEAVYTVPVRLTELPPGLRVASVGPEVLVVRVEGLRAALARVRDEDLRAEVSLRDAAAPGRFETVVQPRHVTVPRGVRVVRVSPSQVRATLEAQ